jgi:hypothetical protein
LHHDLKHWCARPGDRLEVVVDGYEVDVVGDARLLEVQTGNFSALKDKLNALLDRHCVEVVYPIAQERWIRRVDGKDRPVSRRKSPKRGRLEELFGELLRLPETAMHANFSLRVLMIQEEVIWRDDGQGSWRRKGWSVADKRLLQVLDEHSFTEPEAYLALIPDHLQRQFTNQDLAEALTLRRPLATKMTYCLRRMGLLALTGKQGRFNLYEIGDEGVGSRAGQAGVNDG